MATTRILVVGDSITQGLPPGLSFNQTWPGVMQSTLQGAGHSVSVINSGATGTKGGAMASATVGHENALWYSNVLHVHDARFTDYLGIVAYGHNDLVVAPTSDAPTTYGRILAIAKSLVNIGYTKIVLTTIPPSNVFAGATETARQAVNTSIKTGNHGFFVSDIDGGVANFITNTVDGTHPDATGANNIGIFVGNDLLAQHIVK